MQAAVVLIERGDTILCIWNKRFHGWTLPGDRIKANESPDEAVRRALYNELNLDLGTIDLIYSSSSVQRQAVASMVYVFRTDIENQTPEEQENGCPFSWMQRSLLLACSPFGGFYKIMFSRIETQPDLEIVKGD
jgi:ADP-ribose pyrophosphatase YjhB (NUDIX family)